ncbi:hypothetical protein ZWY2020_049806 [Hordeum vulgare]|nr:hypothetical protein ZWY2020_049806 [Hordeum vulgare]
MGLKNNKLTLKRMKKKQTDLEGHETYPSCKQGLDEGKESKRLKSSATKNQKNFNKAEDLTLVDAYLEITQDPIIGVDQSRDCYWNKIDAYFDANKSEDHRRTLSSLQHRWAIIQEQGNSFCACYSQVLYRNQSGMARDNKVTNMLYVHLESRGLKKQYDGLKVLPVHIEEDRLVEKERLTIQEKNMELEEENIRIMRMAEEHDG